MDYWLILGIVAVTAYLLGSINTAIIVSKFALKMDIREKGSGNAGMTNALRVMGAKYTVWVVAGDVLKGIAACIIGWLLLGDYGKLVAGAFAVLGHTFPLYFGFRGGKGVLTTCAVVGMIDWRVMLISLMIFFIIVAITRFVSLGSILAAIAFAISLGFFHSWAIEYIGMASFLAALIIIMHRQNIGRLIKGTENMLSFGKKNE